MHSFSKATNNNKPIVPHHNKAVSFSWQQYTAQFALLLILLCHPAQAGDSNIPASLFTTQINLLQHRQTTIEPQAIRTSLVTHDKLTITTAKTAEPSAAQRGSKHSAAKQPIRQTKPQNIILLLGDGMGPAYTTAYRYFADDPNTPGADKTIFDQLLTGMASTYPAEDSWITDSAASATALASGRKTSNGVIGDLSFPDAIPGLLARAKQLGYATGMVVTSQVNHATPASFVVHNNSRRNYRAIADDFLASPHRADLILGGGWRDFIRPERDLTREFQTLGYRYINHFDQLRTLTTLPALGLFAHRGLPAALDSNEPLRLGIMTAKALSLLSTQERPFVLLIEASQIDWCGHANDISCAMAEMADFASAMTQVKQFIDQRPDSLMVATADHSTGGLTLGRHGVYQWRGDKLRHITTSTSKIINRLQTQPDKLADMLKQELNIKVTATQLRPLRQSLRQSAGDDSDNARAEQQLKHLIDSLTHTGWTTSGHDAIDVPVFAYGHRAELFRGQQDNAEIGQQLRSLLRNANRGLAFTAQ